MRTIHLCFISVLHALNKLKGVQCRSPTSSLLVFFGVMINLVFSWYFFTHTHTHIFCCSFYSFVLSRVQFVFSFGALTSFSNASWPSAMNKYWDILPSRYCYRSTIVIISFAHIYWEFWILLFLSNFLTMPYKSTQKNFLGW